MILQKYLSNGQHLRNARNRCWKLYDKYYVNTKYKHHNDRYRNITLEHLKPSMRLLDAGCGAEMNFLREFAGSVNLAVGADICELKPPDTRLAGVQCNLENLCFKDRSFDVIISMSVMEHLLNPENAFAEFSRVLRSGGLLILQTPNKYDYVSQIARLTPLWFHKWLLSRIAERSEEDAFPTFFRANTKSRILSLMKQSQLQSLHITLFNQYPAYLMFSSLLFRLGVYFERLTSRFDSLAPLRGWILAIAKK